MINVCTFRSNFLQCFWWIPAWYFESYNIHTLEYCLYSWLMKLLSVRERQGLWSRCLCKSQSLGLVRVLHHIVRSYRGCLLLLCNVFSPASIWNSSPAPTSPAPGSCWFIRSLEDLGSKANKWLVLLFRLFWLRHMISLFSVSILFLDFLFSV